MAKQLKHSCHHCGNVIPHDDDVVGNEVTCPHCANTTVLGNDYSGHMGNANSNPWDEDPWEKQMEEVAKEETQDREQLVVRKWSDSVVGTVWGGVCFLPIIVLLLWGFASEEYGHTLKEFSEKVVPPGTNGLPGIIGFLFILLPTVVVGTVRIVLALCYNPFTYLIFCSCLGFGALAGWFVATVWNPRVELLRGFATVLLGFTLSFGFVQMVLAEKWRNFSASKISGQRNLKVPQKPAPNELPKSTPGAPPGVPTKVAPQKKQAAKPATAIDWRVFIGTYRRNPYENTWHVGTITYVGMSGSGKPMLKWRNQAGMEWPLYPTPDTWNVRTGKGNPYLNTDQGNHFEFRPGQHSNSPPVGFQFNQDFFQRLVVPAQGGAR